MVGTLGEVAGAELEREGQKRLAWQSKAILLIVVPWTAVSVVIQARWWAANAPTVVWQALGIGAIFGLIVWGMRAATIAGALTGAVITASLIFSTAQYPYEWSWMHGGLMPLLAVFVLTYVATKIGRAKKERLGTAESKRGRNAAQVAANLGVAALVASNFHRPFHEPQHAASFALLFALAPLAEAAADTVSSEIGSVFGGEPYLLIPIRRVPAGTDGGVTVVGTTAGILAALIVAAVSLYRDNWLLAAVVPGATVGFLFDSLLGATLERKGLLNNDAVNFLSTVSAVIFSLFFAGLFFR
jgi:uncharacterized protein (TIGR00297 family)